MSSPREECTVLLVKPDGIKRGLIGDIISRVEQRGLKIIALKMLECTKEKAHGHYPGTDAWLIGMGNKTLENYKQYGKTRLKKLALLTLKKSALWFMIGMLNI